MAEFAIADLKAGRGVLGICPVPRAQDMAEVLDWGPQLVLSMVSEAELPKHLSGDLHAAGIGWRHLPITDFGAPGQDTAALWPEASDAARGFLDLGGRVLVHCRGGCGRSGMAALRLMVELGEAPRPALERLRNARPCAVETKEQQAWAFSAAPGARA